VAETYQSHWLVAWVVDGERGGGGLITKSDIQKGAFRAFTKYGCYIEHKTSCSFNV